MNLFSGTKYTHAFTIAVYEDKDTDPCVWVAHNLELDLLATDPDKKKAVELLSDLTFQHIRFCIENGIADRLYHPAPKRFWDMVSEKITASVVAQFEEHQISESDFKKMLGNSRVVLTTDDRDAQTRQSA